MTSRHVFIIQNIKSSMSFDSLLVLWSFLQQQKKKNKKKEPASTEHQTKNGINRDSLNFDFKQTNNATSPKR